LRNSSAALAAKSPFYKVPRNSRPRRQRADAVATILKEDGLQIHLNSIVERVSLPQSHHRENTAPPEVSQSAEGTHLSRHRARPQPDTLSLPAA
jgi:hypothetical protein